MAVGRLKTEAQLAEFIRDELNVEAFRVAQGDAMFRLAALEARFPVADLDLASPNNPAWRALAFGTGRYAAAAAGTYFFDGAGGIQANGANAGSTAMLALRASDFAVAGKTTKLRLVVVTMTNGTAPANTLTFGLHPVTSAGAAGLQTLTLGAAVAGSAIAVANPAANICVPTFGPEFALPADAAYILGLVSSGGGAANSVRGSHVQLQMRHV